MSYRDELIYKRRLAGETYRAIAKDIGLSAQRVRQLARREWIRVGSPSSPQFKVEPPPVPHTQRWRAERELEL